MISLNELLRLIKKGESDKVELKQSLSDTKRIVEIVCSFVNSNGGILIIGVNNKGKVVDLDVGKQTIEQLTNGITDNTEPVIYPAIKVIKIKNKNVILIKIEKTKNKPYTAYGKAFIRVGKNTKLMKQSKYEELLLERSKHKLSFDQEICEDANYKDIDEGALNKFRERYEDINKTAIKSSNKELLKSLKCIEEVKGKIKVTNAGILLFGKKPEKIFSMNYITIARYPEEEKAQTYSDIKDFRGNLFDIVESANEYIKEHIQEVSRVIEGRLAREVIPQYPYFAIRELITNAVVHRDYSIRGSRIIIRMFKDRVEFNSPGGLPANITPENIVYEQYSRNPIIADVFSKVKFIEKLGEGWDKIIEALKKHPYKPKLPGIMDTKGTVIVTLYSPKELVKKKIDTVDEWLTKVDARLTQELSDKEKKVIGFILKNGKISSADCQKLLSISREMTNRYFTRLTERNLIVKKGAGKYTYYVLAKQRGE